VTGPLVRDLSPGIRALTHQDTIARQFDRCVKCGLCLPHCPTYNLTLDESESPRGRIALAQAMASGQLAPSERLQAHLDHCLVCRACERACPAEVSYAELIDSTRVLLAQVDRAPRRERQLRNLFARHSRAARSLLSMARAWHRSALRPVARRSGVLRALGVENLDAALPESTSRFDGAPSYRPSVDVRGEVALFTGCTSPLLDGETVQAAVEVLTALGFGVVIPEQSCCGAMHQHGGDDRNALELALANARAFELLQVDAVLGVASGCTATLSEYHKLEPPSAEERQCLGRLGAKVHDINAFLNAAEWPQSVHLAPLRARVLVHEPCSLRNVLRAEAEPYALLQRIPELTVAPMPGNNRCCGGAGLYIVTQADIARTLRQPKLAALAEHPPEYVATSNVGCALHLKAGIEELGLPTEVVHPVTLLARQLGVAAHA